MYVLKSLTILTYSSCYKYIIHYIIYKYIYSKNALLHSSIGYIWLSFYLLYYLDRILMNYLLSHLDNFVGYPCTIL